MKEDKRHNGGLAGKCNFIRMVQAQRPTQLSHMSGSSSTCTFYDLTNINNVFVHMSRSKFINKEKTILNIIKMCGPTNKKKKKKGKRIK